MILVKTEAFLLPLFPLSFCGMVSVFMLVYVLPSMHTVAVYVRIPGALVVASALTVLVTSHTTLRVEPQFLHKKEAVQAFPVQMKSVS